MEYRAMGQSGLKLSALSLGGWLTFGGSITDDDLGRSIVKTALDGGVNFIDLADVYARGKAETMMGRVLSDFPRHELVISSKVFWPMSDDPNDRGLGRKHILESVDRSLERLGTDYLDIYFCHRMDEAVPLEETVEAMSDLVAQGKIHYWGTSLWDPPVLKRAHKIAPRWSACPRVEQPNYNLIERWIEKRIVPTTAALGMGIVVFSPLAGGILSGKYNDGIPDGSRGATTQWLEKHLTEDVLGRARQFSRLAADAGMTPASLALAWVMAQPGISSAICGATSVEQMTDNLLAAEKTPGSDVIARAGQLFAGIG